MTIVLLLEVLHCHQASSEVCTCYFVLFVSFFTLTKLYFLPLLTTFIFTLNTYCEIEDSLVG